MAKMTLEEKKAAMADIGKDYDQILAARAAVRELEEALATKIEPIVKAFGPSAQHKMPLPNGRTLIVTWRKAGKIYETNAVDPDSVD